MFITTFCLLFIENVMFEIKQQLFILEITSLKVLMILSQVGTY